MPAPLRVFVSSTKRDLERDHRAVVDHIRALGFEAVTMFGFTAEPQPTVEADAEKVRGCDLFVLLLAHRYGESPPGRAESYTELEYEVARATKKPRFLFLVDEEQRPLIGTGSQHNRDDGDDWRDRNQRLDALKRRIRDRGEDQATPFADTTELTAKVVQALRQWAEQNQRSPEPGRAAPAAAPAPATEDERDRYRSTLRQRHGEIRLLGFPKTVRLALPLDELYVPLHAVPTHDDQKRSFGGAMEAHTDETLRGGEPCTSLAVVFSQAQRLGRRGFVLLGDPGAGKTTHLRRMALACATTGRGPAELGLADDVLPLFLPLRLLRADDDLATVLPLLLARSLEVTPDAARRLLAGGTRWLFLLDGLDEVPKQLRGSVARWIEQLLAAHADGYFGVTCRYAGYTDDARLDEHFLELHLRPLSDEAIAQFVHNWYRIVERQAGTPRADTIAREHAQDLLRRLDKASTASRRVEEMAANPLLLTIVCLVHRDRGRVLPETRLALYEDCMAVLLERWREQKQLDTAWTAKDAEQVLQPLALCLHEQGKTRLPGADLTPVADEALRKARPGATTGGAEFLAQIRDESGVLVGWANDQFGFLHLGFQEHLAARELLTRITSTALAGGVEPWLDRLAATFGDSWWEEVLLLLLAHDGAALFRPLFERILRQPQFARHEVLLQSCLREAARRDPAPFEAFVREAPGRWQRLRAWLSPAAAAALREGEAARSLARRAIVAIRAGAGLVAAEASSADRRVVHGIELVRIPAGEFRMGSDDPASDTDEGPIRTVRIAKPFWLARTAVTNAQYRTFVQATGAERPEAWRDRKFNGDEQPVVGVSWEDAQAFCRWAGLRLPSEAEWEYACRAGTATPFSFGEDITPEQVNYDGNYPYRGGTKGLYRERTVAVGSLPANPWGLHEMHGNVWEWCEDCFWTYASAPTDGSPQRAAHGSGARVLRGGSWIDDARGCRSAYRFGGPPAVRWPYVGFRPASSSP
jgi:sulfatase modifying factor 1